MDDEAGRWRSISGTGVEHPGWWGACVRWTTAIGVGCALVLWGWQSVVGLTVCLLVIASLAVVAVWGGDSAHDVHQSTTVSLQLTVALVAATGLVGASGAFGLLVILVLVATAPQLGLSRWVEQWRHL